MTKTQAQESVVEGGKIRFVPAEGWAWSNWDGLLAIEVVGGSERLIVKDSASIVDKDLLELKLKLAGKQYTATGFSDVPGVVIAATLRIQEDTLLYKLEIGQRRVVGLNTEGTFTVSCSPSFANSAPPTPDPQAANRTGRWRIDTPGQDVLTAT